MNSTFRLQRQFNSFFIATENFKKNLKQKTNATMANKHLSQPHQPFAKKKNSHNIKCSGNRKHKNLHPIDYYHHSFPKTFFDRLHKKNRLRNIGIAIFAPRAFDAV